MSARFRSAEFARFRGARNKQANEGSIVHDEEPSLRVSLLLLLLLSTEREGMKMSLKEAEQCPAPGANEPDLAGMASFCLCTNCWSISLYLYLCLSPATLPFPFPFPFSAQAPPCGASAVS